MGGKPRLPPPREAPEKLRLLFNNPVIMQSITSMGALRSKPLQVDESVTRRSIYNVSVMGTVCHQMGSLPPSPGGKPMFSQIYINDPDSAARVANRIRMTGGLSAEILSDTDNVMEQYNPYAQQFLHVREYLVERSRPALEMARADRAQRQENEGTHNTPTASEVAAIIFDTNAAQPRDIILYTRQGGFNRIYEANPHYDPLLFSIHMESLGGLTKCHTRVN
ncbi:Helitron helicase-like protein [Phytophthora palmivora]|uniref:Helitron helicase-like protein n=1 Tax=Phytophthora palmivora TaxID=4796 RepID=A0A2P4YMK1_9STRA|nr:Helitron helicase-like protein [Phytophthora palmivora]